MWAFVWIYLAIGMVLAIAYYFAFDWWLRGEEEMDLCEHDIAEIRRMERQVAMIPGGMMTMLVMIFLFWPFFVAFLSVEYIRDRIKDREK